MVVKKTKKHLGGGKRTKKVCQKGGDPKGKGGKGKWWKRQSKKPHITKNMIGPPKNFKHMDSLTAEQVKNPMYIKQKILANTKQNPTANRLQTNNRGIPLPNELIVNYKKRQGNFGISFTNSISQSNKPINQTQNQILGVTKNETSTNKTKTQPEVDYLNVSKNQTQTNPIYSKLFKTLNTKKLNGESSTNTTTYNHLKRNPGNFNSEYVDMSNATVPKTLSHIYEEIPDKKHEYSEIIQTSNPTYVDMSKEQTEESLYAHLNNLQKKTNEGYKTNNEKANQKIPALDKRPAPPAPPPAPPAPSSKIKPPPPPPPAPPAPQSKQQKQTSPPNQSRSALLNAIKAGTKLKKKPTQQTNQKQSTIMNELTKKLQSRLAIFGTNNTETNKTKPNKTKQNKTEQKTQKQNKKHTQLFTPSTKIGEIPPPPPLPNTFKNQNPKTKKHTIQSNPSKRPFNPTNLTRVQLKPKTKTQQTKTKSPTKINTLVKSTAFQKAQAQTQTSSNNPNNSGIGEEDWE
jgi:hypothetical protein